MFAAAENQPSGASRVSLGWSGIVALASDIMPILDPGASTRLKLAKHPLTSSNQSLWFYEDQF
jgi:hypothetical protein